MTDKHMAKIGRTGGLARTLEKAAAARRNGRQPCRPGKRRGRRKGYNAR